MRRFIVAWAISAIALVPVCVSADVQDNDKVAHKIHDVLKQSGRMSGSSFVIKCQDGTAWLEGRVSSEEQKAIALKLTGEVPEVTDVVDNLRVEAKNSRPVARMLAHQTEEPQPEAQEADSVTEASTPAEEAAEAPEQVAETPAREAKPSVMSWFSRPAVKAAAAPHPRTREVASTKPARTVTSHREETVENDAPVYHPEALETADESPSLVKQVANLRTIFRRNSQPAPRSQAAKSAQEPRVMSQPSSKCTTCNTASRSGNRSAQTVSNKTVRNQPTQAGRVRMVPMMELEDGTLVPVQQVKRAPLGQPIQAQTVASSRSKASSGKNGRANVARRQPLVDGPVDVEPAAGPMPGNGPVPMNGGPMPGNGGPLPAYVPGVAAGVAPAYYDQPHMPNYAWPSYAAHPNYAGVTYPRQYSPTAWPYIGPFYPYPQVPLGWRKVTLEWDDGWWFLDFDDTNRSYAY